MKKRLASLLLATAFVFVAGAAFAAWNTINPVPSTGDLAFTVDAWTTVNKSGDLKTVAFTGKDNPFSFAALMTSTDANLSVDKYSFGAVSASVGKVGSGVSTVETDAKNFLLVRLPVAGNASTTEIPVVFFGNTSQDQSTASFDIKFSGATKTSFDVSFTAASGVTSSDSGFKVGKLTVKISKDIYGYLPVAASIDTNLSYDASIKARSFDIQIFALKPNPAVRVHYTYGGVAQTPIIADLVEGTNTVAIPTMMGSATAVTVTAIENIGNTRLVPDIDGVNIADKLTVKKVVLADKFFAGAADNAVNVTLNAGDTKTLFGAPYTVKVTWGGNVDISAATTSGDAATAIANASKNAAVNAFAFNKATGLGAAISGLNLTPTFGTIDSADFSFTASVDAELIAQRADATKPLLSAVAFNARVTSPDAVQIAMLGLDMTLEISGDVLSDRLGATAWKAMRTKLAATPQDTDSFLAAFSFYKYFAASSTKVDLISFVGAAKRSDYFTVALTAGDTANSNVTVQFKNVFLADGPSADGKAEAKFETINGREVLVLFDGVRDGWIKDPSFVDGKGGSTPDPEETKYAISGTVKFSDGGAAKDVVVALWTLEPEAVVETVSTDINGAYAFAKVVSGDYEASFSLNGYQQEWRTFSLTDDKVLDDVSLTEGAALRLRKNLGDSKYTGDIAFVVKDKDGVEVALTSDDYGYRADIARGEYTIAATVDAGFSVKTTSDYDGKEEISSFTIDENSSARFTVYGVVTADGGSSSSGGCNVGFAPLALLLLAPVMFLKK